MARVNCESYIEGKLRDGGYKVTPQRLNILRILYKNNRHMSADEIYDEVRVEKIGLTTVYRNLMIFEKIGLVTKISITNINYYELELMNEYKVHIHARCSKCNKIMDIDEIEATEEYMSLIKKLKKKFKIAVESISVVTSECCKSCNPKLKEGNFLNLQ